MKRLADVWQVCAKKERNITKIAFELKSKGALLTFNFSWEVMMEKFRTDVDLSGRKTTIFDAFY